MEQMELAVATATKKLIDDGTLATAIEGQIKATMARIVQDTLGPYTEFAKSLAAAVGKSVAINPDELDLHRYNQVVLNVVRTKLDAAVDQVFAKKIGDEMEQLLADDAPKSIKLTQLIRDFKEWVTEKGKGDGRCTINFEDPADYGTFKSSTRWLQLDPKPNVSRYACQFRMLVPVEGGVPTMFISGVDPKKTLFMGQLYDFEKKLFQMYVAGTTIEIDSEDFSNYLDEESDF